MTAPAIRPGRDDDAAGFIALVDACWSEYPGCVMDLDGEVPELRALATYYSGQRGALWAAERDGRIVGMIGTRPLAAGAWEICKVYVARDERGSALGHGLLDAAEAHARREGATRLELWTDTRFDRAHRFYEKRSYVRAGPIRVLDDLSRSLEFHYAKPLGPIVVERLDAAGAASAERRLADILIACVGAGDSVSFLPPLDPARARAFWRGVSAGVATGGRVLLVAWADGVLAGTVQLDTDTPQDQPHRAELRMLLVDPARRRRGIGRALMAAAEAAAREAGRSLLTLGASGGDAAEPFCRRLSWQEAGRVPGGVRNAAGVLRDALVFLKSV